MSVYPGSSWVWECEWHIQRNKRNDRTIKVGKKPPGSRPKHCPGNCTGQEGLEPSLSSGNTVLSPDLHSEPRNGHQTSSGARNHPHRHRTSGVTPQFTGWEGGNVMGTSIPFRNVFLILFPSILSGRVCRIPACSGSLQWVMDRETKPRHHPAHQNPFPEQCWGRFCMKL